MSESIQTPIVEQPVELRYEYQPTDEMGRPIGAKQVIKYTTPEELAQKFAEQNTLLIRKLREQTRKVRLGIVEEEPVAEDAQRFNGPVEFNPRELTEEQRYDISRRLLDPATAADAASELVEARLGAPLETIGTTLRAVQQDNIDMRANLEAHAFADSNPGYYRCQENFEAITSWMVRYNLAPVRANFQKAYDTLKAQGIIIEGPAPVAVVETVAEVEPIVEVQTVVPPATEPVVEYQRGIASGLTRENASDAGTPIQTGSDIVYKLPDGRTLVGLAAIAAMPSEEYKHRLQTERGFSAKVDKLEAEARKPRVQ